MQYVDQKWLAKTFFDMILFVFDMMALHKTFLVIL